MPIISHQKIALLLMAAGSSSRLGQPKQLIEIVEKQKQSQSLLRRQITIMNSVSLSTNAASFCVLGSQREKLRTHLVNFLPAKTLTLVDNPHWSHGLSASIAKGVSSLGSDIDAVLILLVDQWQLTAENLTSLILEWQQQPDKIHIASHNDCISPPVIFPSSLFNELTLLSGDSGAKQVINKHMKNVILKEMPSAFVDLDTPEQLLVLKKKNKTHITNNNATK